MASKIYTAQEMLEAAHKREMADKLDDDHGACAICLYDTRDDEWRPLWRKPNSVVLALRQAADAMESEGNKCGDCAKFGGDCSAGDVDGNEDCRACKQFVSKEVSALRALVKELADALEGRLCDFDCEIHGECLADMEREECESFNMRPLVARAREAIGGGVTKTVENCERMRCCEKRQESAIACESCIIKDSCETHKKEVDNGKKD